MVHTIASEFMITVVPIFAPVLEACRTKNVQAVMSELVNVKT